MEAEEGFKQVQQEDQVEIDDRSLKRRDSEVLGPPEQQQTIL